jgi:c-di-GMP-related signal transduction protein
LESAQLKDAIRKRAQKIEELVRKDPSKAAKILSDWINSAQSSKKSTALPAKGPLRRKSD